MPNYDNCVFCDFKVNRINIFIASIVCIGVGLILMFFVNKSAKPFGESISDHPLKLLGIILIIIGCVFSIMVCMHLLIANKSPTTSVSQATLTSRRSQNQASNWSVTTTTRTEHLTTYSTDRQDNYLANNQSYDASALHQDFVRNASSPKPVDLDLPPSYEEVMGTANRPIS